MQGRRNIVHGAQQAGSQRRGRRALTVAQTHSEQVRWGRGPAAFLRHTPTHSSPAHFHFSSPSAPHAATYSCLRPTRPRHRHALAPTSPTALAV